MENKLQKMYDEYKKKFNDDFPTVPLAVSLEDKEIIEIIENCISRNKDVYELGYLELNNVCY